MNILKKCMLLFTILCTGIATTSCGSDEDEKNEPDITTGKWTEVTFAGTTTTYPVSSPESKFTTEVSTYTYSMTENGTFAIAINKAKFLGNMPELDMQFNDIEVYDNSSNPNNLYFRNEALTPEIGGRPFPTYPISDLTSTMHRALTGNELKATSVELRFICTFRDTPYQVIFNGTPAVK